MQKKLIISNYNSDLNWLDITYPFGFSKQNTIIYDRSDTQKDWSHLGTCYNSPNVGENIYDIMRFIVENYKNIPDISIFLKGNLFQREKERGGENYYTTKDRFFRALNSDYFLPIERYHESTSFRINGVGFIQENWDPKTNSNIYFKYFSSLIELMDILFDNPFHFEYSRFAPGANYVVPKSNILKYTKKFYEKLMQYVAYTPPKEYYTTCAEAFLIERLLYIMWTEDLVEKKYENI